MLKGTTGLTDARGPDRLYSIHYAFTARGFKSSKGRRWRTGEAERAALYGVREDALEGGERGWWSNIAADRNELAAHYQASEALEKHDRANANVYVSEVIALPAELTARQRRCAVRRICRWFEKRGLPYAVGIHLPDPTGDQRNYHCHIVYSLRPCRRIVPYEWDFAAGKQNDINTPAGIRARRLAVVRAINATLHAAKIDKRYTHLSNTARNMAPAIDGKVGQQVTWARRRLAAVEQQKARLATLARIVIGLRPAVSNGIGRLDAAYQTIDWAFDDMARNTRVRHAAAAIADARLQAASVLAGIAGQLAGSLDPTDAVRITLRRGLASLSRQVDGWSDDGGVRNMQPQVARRIGLMRHGMAAALGGDHRIDDHRHAIDDPLDRMIHNTVAVGAPDTVRAGATRTADGLRALNTRIARLITEGAARMATMSRRIERGGELDDVNVTLMETLTGGALQLADQRAALIQRLGAILPEPANGVRVDAARAGVLDRLRRIATAIDPRAPAARDTAVRLYLAKRRVNEPTADSPAMRAVRAHSLPPSPEPAQNAGIERQPGAALPPPEPNAPAPAAPRAETIASPSDRELARAMAIERERRGRDAAWTRLMKAGALVTRDGADYAIDMAGISDIDRALLLREGFADELQRRLRDVFDRQAVLAASDAPQQGEDDVSVATQFAFQRGTKERG